MAISLRWTDESHSVIVGQYDAQWTWDEFFRVHSEQLPRLLDNVSHRVDYIVDFSLTRFAPNSLRQFARIAGLDFWSHPNLGLVIVAAASGLTQEFVLLFSRTYKPIPIVETVDDALRLTVAGETVPQIAGDPG